MRQSINWKYYQIDDDVRVRVHPDHAPQKKVGDGAWEDIEIKGDFTNLTPSVRFYQNRLWFGPKEEK